MDYQCLEEDKNKEIAELRKRINKTDKDKRHQICEEIREKVNEIAYWECEYDCQMIVKDEFDTILDQIEKGE